MKKLIVFGGGTGLSCLLSGLKQFPVEVTTVITVSDNGSSTGVLKQEFDIPAVGDVGKVLLAMANVDDDLLDLLSYRFRREGSSLDNHPVRNILLTALIDLKGNLTEATRYMSRLLNIKGEVLPLTEERVDLVGRSRTGKRSFYGEESVSRNIRSIASLSYDHDIHISNAVKQGIANSDLIIFSPGSLYTSILPHLIVDDIVDAICASKAPIMYVSNLVTQPGETDRYNVSDHLKVLNRYLGDRRVEVVISNNADIDPEIVSRYLESEGKTLVEMDRENVEALGARIIEDGIFSIEDGRIRHDALKTAFLIFSYLMGSRDDA
ncbi:MAG: YvcK family protein [Clostridia bacterium]|nr:YvcK family protein [Clostridia bacterium]MBQ6374871.1 YvcK family protein [Clostridia bacterium]